MTITKELAKFAVEMSYEKLPPAVIDQSKRLILDSVGCAVGGLASRKGWYSISLARTLAGPPVKGGEHRTQVRLLEQDPLGR